MSEPLLTLPVEDTWLPSPCVGICQLDQATGWCGGCGRSEKELAGWRDMSSFAQRAVWGDLPRRKSILGLGYRLLPMSGPLLLERLSVLSKAPDATWNIGVPGAGASFAANDDQLAVVIEDGRLTLRTDGGQGIVHLPAGTRAFELAGQTGEGGYFVLALHRARLKAPASTSITCLGQDEAAILPEHRGALLFDLGLGRKAMQFCVRTSDPDLIASLTAHAGRELLQSPELMDLLMQTAPERVVMSPLGRIEVEGPMLRNEPTGPCCRLTPDLLRSGRDLEPGLELPPDYVPCAHLVATESDSDRSCPSWMGSI